MLSDLYRVIYGADAAYDLPFNDWQNDHSLRKWYDKPESRWRLYSARAWNAKTLLVERPKPSKMPNIAGGGRQRAVHLEDVGKTLSIAGGGCQKRVHLGNVGSSDYGHEGMKHPKAVAALVLIFGFTASAYGRLAPQQYSTPGIYGDTLIFSRPLGSELYAVDIKTKADVWVWSSGTRSVWTRPTIFDGVAYIWAGGDYATDSRACAVDCRTGKSLWETPAGKGSTWDPATIVGDVVLFPADGIRAFDRKTGEPLWVQTGYEMMLVYGYSVLATTGGARQLALLDARTGKTLFQTELSEGRYAEAKADCSAGGEVVVGCDGMLLKMNIPEQRVLWRIPTPKERWIPAIDGDRVYLLSDYVGDRNARQRLQIRLLSDGSIQRQIDMSIAVGPASPALLFEGTIVIASGGRLVGLDRQSLQERWRVDGGSEVSRDERSVYVGATGPSLRRIEARAGTVMWSYGSRIAQSPGRVNTGKVRPVVTLAPSTREAEHARQIPAEVSEKARDTARKALYGMVSDISAIKKKYPELAEWDARSLDSPLKGYKFGYSHSHQSGEDGMNFFGNKGCWLGAWVAFDRRLSEYRWTPPDYWFPNLGVAADAYVLVGQVSSPGFQAEIEAILSKHMNELRLLDEGVRRQGNRD